MPTKLPRILLKLRYAESAREYAQSLPLEHYMEATTQGRQREISLASFALIRAARSDVHFFNELLVQYEQAGKKKPGHVVPDNMVVINPTAIIAEGSYDIPLQPAKPFMMLEYVSKNSKRKDYDDNMDRYEQKLKVPYYLLFYPDDQELNLFHHSGRKYHSVKPGANGRCAIPELDLEVALLDGWVRYWFRGELLPLPAELLHQRDEERRRADEEHRRADEEHRRADEQHRRADEQRRRADEAGKHVEEERRGRLAAEEELARLRAELNQSRRKPGNGK